MKCCICVHEKEKKTHVKWCLELYKMISKVMGIFPLFFWGGVIDESIVINHVYDV